MIKKCVICGKEFNTPPSNNKTTCSTECRRKRAAIAAANRKGTVRWSIESRERFSQKLHSNPEIYREGSQKGLAKAQSLPDSQRGPQNRESKIWILIDPSGNYVPVTNLLDWSRKNYTLFEPPCDDVDKAATRISSGFRAIASSLRGKRTGNQRAAMTYKGWGLAKVPSKKHSKVSIRTGSENIMNDNQVKNMKKVIYHWDDGRESDILYVGIPSLYGEFLLTTHENPTNLNELEDANTEDCDTVISEIEKIINDPKTPWKPCDDEDEKYVAKWLDIWEAVKNMKKVIYHWDGAYEADTLYVGIPALYGEFLVTTNGEPVTLTELEDANNEDCDASISEIKEIINDPNTPWEPCDGEDKKYVAEWLDIWGIA